MVQVKINGTVNGHKTVNGVNGVNGHAKEDYSSILTRPRPQETYDLTSIEPDSFYGKLRDLYAEKVLKTQLEQLKKQGSYDAFKLQWHPAYEVRRLYGGKARTDGIPPSLFWESDVGKWVEAACYFLSCPDAKRFTHYEEFDGAIQELVDMIEKAQQPDGYLNIYFTVVDQEGRFKNLRDMHEMYNAGHLLEAALAHYKYTGSRQFIDVMIRNVDCLMHHFGLADNQLHGYPGHPELELAMLRLYSLTQDRRHLQFAKYLLEARGVKRDDQRGDTYFVWEAKHRKDEIVPPTMDTIEDVWYHQAHEPIRDQEDVLGHSVRAFYLLTAAADLGGSFLNDAKRLWSDAVDKKMYVTGGFGTEPRIEGFSRIPHHLPQSTGEGGCYAETCASIAVMMTSERILSHELNGKVRDVLELCLLNNTLGGGSLKGDQFSYANKLASWGDEDVIRHDWFEVCCCPGNVSRQLGMLGGYTWSVNIDVHERIISLDIYILLSATRNIPLPNGQSATVSMRSEMPWQGKTEWEVNAPEGWNWKLKLPNPDYAENVKVSEDIEERDPGFLNVALPNSSTVTQSFDMPIRLLAPHIATGQDTLTVSRGPIVYTAEAYDNFEIEGEYKHFEGVGITSNTTFEELQETIHGIPVITLQANQPAYALNEVNQEQAYRVVNGDHPSRSWKRLSKGLKFVPWFARGNRGGVGHLRTGFLRADEVLSQA
ncbi:hypothetical protein I204_00836 [Kwoniella mangroviensis CBS 8886]|nr:uncharacterized protein I203_05791 [Kwoniella mangroviensis CBS 8507]OCF65049.1 hypothetical protein I203_05791 [Kwoniella mangroviensis CBS 8507]OCF78892.1 hypothetical protein I204_00836 [Kwoniella mangroviensis CBS 8886]